MSDQIGRLAAEVAQTHERVTERFAAMDALHSELAALASDVGGVQEKLDEVVRMQRVQQTGMSSSPVVQSMQRALSELRGDLATVGSRLVGLDARLDELQSLPVRMEDVAARQFQRLVPEMLTVPGDLEGVYRELERIAERMAGREQAVTQAVERVAAVEETVTGLRLDLDRVIGGLAAAREAEAEARDWRLAMERRLAALEAPGSEVERLYLALDRMVGERAAIVPTAEAGADEEGRNGAPPFAGGLPRGGDHEAAENDRAVEALTAELERIRRSIEGLVRPGARRSSGHRR
jgi:predicted  nucleic acid-binding Zn-ribbon protein